MAAPSTAPPSPARRERLADILRDCHSVVVGYSGGVDSVFLARLAVDVLGRDRVLAVTGLSAAVPSWGRKTAREVAARFGIPWHEIDTREGDDPRYVANPSNRCYFCKTELWDRLSEVARERGFRTVVDGANADDAGDHRPGGIAAREHGVRSPLLEAGLGKSEIRAWSRELGLPTWDQPAAPCLASRLPYGLAVTPERLAAVEEAEAGLRALGLREFRVRHHGEVARIEASAEDRARLADCSAEAVRRVRRAGFAAVLVDLEGYRRGALNEGLAGSQLVSLGA
jgi:pyridinium-3,5-biscarboxylic acid mononucleotide sulfurtransferase